MSAIESGHSIGPGQCSLFRGLADIALTDRHVRYWHLADMRQCAAHVRVRGKADASFGLQTSADPGLRTFTTKMSSVFVVFRGDILTGVVWHQCRGHQAYHCAHGDIDRDRIACLISGE